MATAAQLTHNPAEGTQDDLDLLAQDFFELAESQLASMPPDQRTSVMASIHATAESLRAEQ